MGRKRLPHGCGLLGFHERYPRARYPTGLCEYGQPIAYLMQIVATPRECDAAPRQYPVGPEADAMSGRTYTLLFGMTKVASLALLWAAHAVLTLLLLLTGTGRRLWRGRKLAGRFPGPVAWPLLGNLPDLPTDPSEFLEEMLRLSRLHGPVFRLWLGPVLVIVISGPADVEAMMTSPATYVNRGALSRLISYGLPHSILQMNGAAWWRRKRQLQPAFHTRVLDNFAPVICRQGDIFVGKLAKLADGRPFDASPLVEALTFDVLCESAMGVNLDVQNNGDSAYFHAVMKVKFATMERSQKPWLYPDWAFGLSALGRKASEHLTVLRSVRDKVISTRIQKLEQRSKRPQGETETEAAASKRRLAFLDLLLQTPGLTEADVGSEVDMLLVAGHDTTHCALTFALYLLSQHQEVQGRVRRELEQELGLDPGSPGPVQASPEQLARLPYLDRVVREVLRLYPPNVLLVREALADTPLATGGLVVPKGANVLILPCITVKSPEHFPDPDKFDPDRWLPENCKDVHPYAFFPFGGGPRSCSGKRFALNEVKTTVAKVLWAFQLLPAPGPPPRMGYAVTGCPAGKVMLRLLPRAV